MRFYDYIELQPLANFSTALALGSIPSMERLKEVIQRIIRMAKKLGKGKTVVTILPDTGERYFSTDLFRK